MRQQQKPAPPPWLEEKATLWGQEWQARITNQPGARFNWRQHQGRPVNQQLIPLLRGATQAHCSFCDAFPVNPPSTEQIEHFRPKSRFPLLAWDWSNLYYCCAHCQTAKRDLWDDRLLAPDEPGYAFDRWFIPDYTTGRIDVMPNLPPPDYDRAVATLEVYALNHPGHCAQRRAALERRSALQDWPLDEFPYRDFVA